jgi:peptide/nickel transport system substrate-binding protein/oligopeptide transport system substrate-binding protein
MVQMWQQAFPGLKISTSFIDFNSLITLIYTPNVPQIYDILWIADYPDPQDWLSLQFSQTSTINAGFVVDPQANTLMAKADVNLDPTTRYQEYNQAEQSLVDQAAWIPYSQQLQYWNVEPYVHGFYLPAGQLVPLSGPQSWQSMYLTAH